MKHLVSLALFVVGMIHLLPLSGVLSAKRLVALYGVPITDANLEILLRHRAVLFGLLGGFLLVAAFKPKFQLSALCTGFISVLSFLYLAWTVGSYNPQIARVFLADIVALGFLVLGLVAYALVQRKKQ